MLLGDEIVTQSIFKSPKKEVNCILDILLTIGLDQ